MPDWLRNLLAIVAGFVVGSAVNMAIVVAGPTLIPPPPGVDLSSAEGLARAMPLLEPRHFLAPWLAHALGTLAGALVARLLSCRAATWPAYAVGVLFLLGGVAAAAMIPAPAWFIALDLLLAYLPMAWLGARIAGRIRLRGDGAPVHAG
jgi:hypothetical protein